MEARMLLEWVEAHSLDPRDRRQAARELVTCNRKLAWWTRHPNWSAEQAGRDLAEIRRRWAQK